MRKRKQHDDPLLQLQQEWRQQKEGVRTLPFLSDEEMKAIFLRSQELPPEPLPETVVNVARQADRYTRMRPCRYAVAIGVALLLVSGVWSLTPPSATLSHSTDPSINSQSLVENVTTTLNNIRQPLKNLS